MEGNFDFSKMPFGEVLKMAIATVVEESNRRQNVTMISNVIEGLRPVIREEVARLLIADHSRGADVQDEELLFGYFHRNDLVCKCDKRLYKGPHAPFTSKDGVQRFSSKFPTLFIEGGRGLLVAKAGDIYDMLYNQKDRDLVNGKGIKFNRRRK